MINYNNKKFRPVSYSDNGEVSSGTIFNYHEEEGIVWADYSGGDIKKVFSLQKKTKKEILISYINI